MNMDFFLNPPNCYRPASFWAWNDELKEDELLAQIDHFAEGGLGGFFMHARGDLRTPYLSTMMMDCVNICVKHAKEKGLAAWIYDEHGWPSGQAAGNVQKIRNANNVKHLVCKPAVDDFAVAGEVSRENINGTQIVFGVEYGSGVEQLNSKTVKDFIELTHERYKEKCEKYFGDVIPGTFFDEPQYATYYDENNYVPWTALLPETFEKMWGYDLVCNLKSLFFDIGNFEQVRIHYWYTIAELYANSFAKQIMDWCESNNLKSTGHFEWEETFYGQIRCCGNLMRQYEYMHYPGNDQLGRGMNAPWIYKQTASVAAQLAKPRYMVECFGVSGQNMTLHDKRWLYGKLLCLGVDFLVPHISLYSMRGDNKRDHPPHNLHQQPWWKYNHFLEDSASRASYVLSQGKKKADVLVLNPIVTAWSDYKPGDTLKIEELQKHYENVNWKLLNNGIVYHIGEETLFDKYAKIDFDKFFVGDIAYSAIILPFIRNVLPVTIRLLHEFSDCGGKICILGVVPSGCEELHFTYFDTEDKLLSWVNTNTKPSANFETKGKELWVNNFELDGFNAWFLSNPDRTGEIEVEMYPADCSFAVNRLITESGECECIKSVNAKECEFRLYGGEYIILVQSNEGTEVLKTETAYINAVDLDGEWKIESHLHTTSYNNCANLDFCRMKQNDECWSSPTYTRDVYDKLVKEKDTVTQVLSGWTADFKKIYSYQANFEFINNANSNSFTLCLESPEELGITINGKPLQWQDTGSFIDSSFRTCDISGYMCAGSNEIVLSGKNRPNLTFEDIYILGDFSVTLAEDNTRVLTPLKEAISATNDLEEDGYKFFAGEICLSKNIDIKENFKKAVLTFEEPNAAVFEVIINGVSAGVVWCSPWEIELTRLLNQGENVVEVKLTNSIRNLLGPLHNTLGEFQGIGPAQYNNKSAWSDRPVSAKFGFGKAHLSFSR